MVKNAPNGLKFGPGISMSFNQIFKRFKRYLKHLYAIDLQF